MVLPNRKRPPSLWPFWLLTVAWVCANSPQAATFAVLDWIGEAHSFSHQQRLASEVARLLEGEPSPPAATSFRGAPLTPPKPAIPATAALKKIELAVEDVAQATAPPESAMSYPAAAGFFSGIKRSRPPHEPPRSTV